MRVSAVSVAALMIMSVASAGVLYIGAGVAVRPRSFWEAMTIGMSDWMLWPVMIPCVIWLSRRFPIGRASWARGMLAHATASVAFALAAIAVTLGMCSAGLLPFHDSQLWEPIHDAIGQWFHFNVLAYWVVVSAVHAVDYHRRYQQRQVEAA